MGQKTSIEKLPKIFYVNWFRKDEKGNFLWPGFGENSRVLKWIFERCDATISARKTPIGYLPYLKDLDVKGLSLPKESLRTLLTVEKSVWAKEAKAIRTYFCSLGDKFPPQLFEELDILEKRLKK